MVVIRALSVSLGLFACACTCTGPRTGIPSYDAVRAEEAPSIDGQLDDAVWSAAPWTEVFVNTMSGDPAEPRSRAKIAWDDDAIYVAFDVADPFLIASYAGQDPHLWEQDCVELMFDPDGDGQNYFELQLSPTDQVFDTRYDARRVPQPFGHVDWNSGMRGAAQTRGEPNDEEDDEGYAAEVAIPWSAFDAGATPAGRPSAGDEWRLALYVLDARREGGTGVGWSAPLVGDFHVPDRFGRLLF